MGQHKRNVLIELRAKVCFEFLFKLYGKNVREKTDGKLLEILEYLMKLAINNLYVFAIYLKYSTKNLYPSFFTLPKQREISNFFHIC